MAKSIGLKLIEERLQKQQEKGTQEYSSRTGKKIGDDSYVPDTDVLYRQYAKAREPKAVGGTANPFITTQRGVMANQNVAPSAERVAGRQTSYYDQMMQNKQRAEQMKANTKPSVRATAQDVKDALFGKAMNYGTVNPRISASEINTKYNSMTDDEASVYMTLRNQGRQAEADEYLKAVEYEINERNMNQTKQKAKEIGGDGVVAPLLYGAALSIPSSAGILYNAWQDAKGEATDMNHGAYGGSAAFNALYDAYVNGVNGEESPRWKKDLKGTAMTVAQMMGHMPAGMFAPLTMGASAASGASMDALNRGGTTEQALFGGLAAGAAEGAGSALSLGTMGKIFGKLGSKVSGKGMDRLRNLAKEIRKDKGRAIAIDLLKISGVEGSEEMVTEVMNALTDMAIMGENSNFNLVMEDAMAKGMSEEEAFDYAMKATGQNVLEAGKMGAMAGGLMGGLGMGVNAVTGRNIIPNNEEAIERARAQYEAATRQPDVPDTNVGETEQLNTAAPQNPATGHETAISDELTDSSPATKTQPTEAQTKQARDRDSYLDKYYHENGANILRAEAEKRGSLQEAEDIYRPYYTAGLTGQAFDSVKGAMAVNADRSVAMEMYQAGVNDKAADMTARIKGQDKLRRSNTGVNLMTEAITDQQKALANLVARVGGMNVTIVDTLGKDGKVGNNGEYTRGTNEVVIAMDAESFSGTLFHETVHYIKQANAKGYERMAEAVFRMAAEMDGVSVSDYLRRYESMEAYGPAIEAGAYNFGDVTEELVADAFQMLAADEARCRSLIAELQQTEPTVLEQIKEFLQKMLETLEGLVKDGRFHAFAEDINKDIENTKKLQKIFAEELREAGKTAETKKQPAEQSVLEKVGVQIDTATESATPKKFSRRTWEGSDYVTERNKAAKEMAEKLGITQKKAKAYIDAVNGVAKMIADNPNILDYESNEFASAFVSNSEYGGSIDFSTICKKRRWMTGTLSAIQRALPHTALTAEEVLDIRNRMKEKGYEVSCGLCYVEGSRTKMGEFTSKFIELYKRDNPPYVPTMAEMNTPEGLAKMMKEHPEVYDAYEYFYNHYGKLRPDDKALFASQQKPKLYQLATEYKGEVLEKFKDDEGVELKNKNGGLRLQSFSDFEVIHLIDAMQVITDMARVGLAGQAYTKVPDFAWALGDTGLKINLSLIAKGVDENGRLILDEVEGMPRKDAEALRNRYSDNVGTIIVVFNDEQLYAAMNDDFIDFIIPFHRSQWKKSQYPAMGLPAKVKDYTYQQNEKLIKKTYHEWRGKMVLDKPTNYMPNEYWDFTKSGKENAENYLQMCAENNKRPKFYKLLKNNGDGSYSLQDDGSTDGYWKLLIDFKMYNNEGKGVPQNAVVPEFNMDEAFRMLGEYGGDHAQFPVAQDVVDEFVAEKQGAKFSMREKDAEYMAAVNSRDMKKAQAMVDAAAEEAMPDSVVRDKTGKLIKVYHGTEERFTVFRDRNDGANAVYFSPWESFAEDYGETKAYYVDLRNPVHYDEDFEVINDVDEDDADGFIYLIDAMYDYDEIDQGVVGDTEIGVFDARRIKSADAVVYDDRGDVIPLSQRFNMDSKDIRYSVRESGEAELRRENASLISENKHLQKLNENLKKQFKLTDGKTPDPKAVKKVAKEWLKQIQSKADVEDFSMKLGKITEYFAKAEDKNDHDHAMAALRVLVREAMEEAETLNTEMRDSYSDMIDRIKNTTLKVTEAAREKLEYYGGYNSFRREHFSSMTLNSQKGASIDSFYNELCSDYPEFFKEEDATTEGEQLMRISEVLDTLKPVAENPYGYYIDEYVYDETMGLLDKMADIQMEQTFADKKKAEKTAAMQKLKDEFRTTLKTMRDEAKEAQEKAIKEAVERTKTAEQMYAGRKMVEVQAKYQRLKHRNKENADKRKRSAYRKSAEKTMKELLNWMRKPNEKKHVQEAYLPLIQVLTKIDTGRKDIEIKQADVASIVSKLDKLEKEGYASDLTDAVRNIANNFEDYFEDGMHLEDMTTEQMKALRDFIKGIKHIIVDNNKAKAMEQIERISDLGDGVIDKADKSKNVKATGRGRALADFFGLELLTPNVFFKGITDSVHENLYKGLRTAHEQKAGMVNEAMTFINEESRLKDRAKWERDKVREFTVSNGQKAYLTVPQIMSLYCHMKREQSKVHIVGGEIKQINGNTKVVQAGGIQIEPYDGRWTGLKNRKAAEAAMKQTERILVTEEDVKTITDTLTEQQKKLADAIQKFFSTVAAGWGNATSMLMWGYKNFLEPNYFPIESSEDFMVREYGVNADGRPVKQLKNLGFTHNTVTGANNPIIIRDIFSVFATHIDQMASYAAFVPILSDMQKFMNYKQYEQVGVTEDGKPVWKLKSSVSNALKVFMGLKAEGYINDLMRQINMAAGRDDTSSFPVQMTRRMKIAVVGANLRVMAQQPTSIVRAAAVINPVYLLNPANTALPADYRMMYKYAPISLLKKWGGADMDTGRTMKQMLTGGNWYDKTVDISMWGAGALDARTWGRIWKACVQETKAKNRGLEGEELYLKAGQRFADVIDETQVVDTPLHRTAIMRKDSTLMKMATSFMSEPLKTYNMLFDIGRNLYQNPKDGKAYRKFVATSFTLFLNAVAVSAAAGLVDAMRDDDEDEEFWDKWMKAFSGDYSEVVTKKDFAMAALTSNLGDNMNPAAMIPFVKDAWSIIQGYDVERTDVTWMADMVNWAKNMIKFMEGDSKFTMQGMMKNTAENFSKMLGVPAKSLLRDLEAIENTYINHIIKVDDGERIKEQIDKKARTHRMGSEDNLNYYIDKIVKLHFTGNDSLGADYANKLVDSGIDSEKVQDRIDSALKDRCKAEPAAMEAAEAWLAKDYTTMESKLDELKDMGYSGEVAQSAMTSLYNKMIGEDDEPSAEEIKEPFEGDDVDYKKIYRADLKEAYENGGNTGRIENQLRSLGLKDKDINGVYRDKISDMFDKANAKGNKTEMERLIDEYVKYNGKESTLRNRIK